jgi:hypothetical protein
MLRASMPNLLPLNYFSVFSICEANGGIPLENKRFQIFEPRSFAIWDDQDWIKSGLELRRHWRAMQTKKEWSKPRFWYPRHRFSQNSVAQSNIGCEREFERFHKTVRNLTMPWMRESLCANGRLTVRRQWGSLLLIKTENFSDMPRRFS